MRIFQAVLNSSNEGMIEKKVFIILITSFISDCVECMACSDNVIRAGLTPKYRDVDTLLKVLDYSCCPVGLKLLNAERESNCSVVYRPPVPEFAVSQICVSIVSKRSMCIYKNCS